MSSSSPPPRLPAAPPEAWEPLLRLTRLAARPLDRFLRIEASSGIVLMAAAAVALLWANSPWAESYAALWETPFGVRLGGHAFERSLAWFVNDGLMAIFFFVVGLEIRREMHHGELSDLRRAALPIAAALGGVVVPALVYLALAGGPATRNGWAVPMATDIAFALGVLALLGKRVPPALRVLLLAVAVIDDLCAILVIAIFYSSGVSLGGFGVAALGLGGVFALQRLGVRSKLAYLTPAILAWAGIYAGGIHPTIAGVIVGLATPVRAWLGPDGFVAGVQRELDELSTAEPAHLTSHQLAARLKLVDVARREAMSPAESLIEALHPWVAYGIMPIFALANAGVALGGSGGGAEGTQVVLAVVLGLVLGKPAGVLLASGLTLKLGLSRLPAGLSMRHLAVLGVVAGIGFTMALFVAQLAFPGGPLLPSAKVAILIASGLAAALALGMGRLLLPVETAGAAATADEAESSTEK